MKETRIGNEETLNAMRDIHGVFQRFPIRQTDINAIFEKLEGESSVKEFIASQILLRRGVRAELFDPEKIRVIGTTVGGRQVVGVCSSAYISKDDNESWLKALVAFGEKVRPVEFSPDDCIRYDVIVKVQNLGLKHHGNF